MRRKVSKIGPSTLMVSLPAKWVKKYNIKKGAEIDIEEQNSKLIINARTEKEGGKISLNTADFGHFDKNFISYLYQKGYDEIEVRFDDVNTFNIIEKKLNSLLGFEIINQTQNSCIIRSVSAPLEKEFDPILRRTFLILLDMGRSCYIALEKQEYDNLKEIALMERTIDKLTDFLKRVLNKKGYGDKTIFIYCIVRDLEKIGDIYRDVCKYFLEEKNRKQISKDVLNIFNQTNNFLELFYKLFYKFDKEFMLKLHEEKKNLLKKAFYLFEKSQKKEQILIHHLITLITMTFDLYGPYFTMVF